MVWGGGAFPYYVTLLGFCLPIYLYPHPQLHLSRQHFPFNHKLKIRSCHWNPRSERTCVEINFWLFILTLPIYNIWLFPSLPHHHSWTGSALLFEKSWSKGNILTLASSFQHLKGQGQWELGRKHCMRSFALANGKEELSTSDREEVRGEERKYCFKKSRSRPGSTICRFSV